MAQREDGTRDRILKTAGAIFAEHGYERATIREISSQANVNLASINYHFGDKERLYRETIRFAHEFCIQQVPFPEWSADTPPESQLRLIVHALMQRLLAVQSLPWYMRLLMREHIQPSDIGRELAEDFIRPQHEMLVKTIAALAPAGTPDWKLQQFAFSVVGQCLYYKLGNPIVRMLVPVDALENHFSPTQLADHITEVMLASFRGMHFASSNDS
ncbi:TetR/AcrR family transcriptional regulator [Planctomicrobium sp. SH527]|uniref:TetR/AcrR family transcriptional regulator n=1 Tax=Planctomicrobium sp. SH527 TaxID=3448123 RepID=UPI003F5C4717